MYISLNCKTIAKKIKKREKNTLKENRKNVTKKTTKKYNQKIQQKRRGDKKEWVQGEEEPTEKIFVQCFCLNHLVFSS